MTWLPIQKIAILARQIIVDQMPFLSVCAVELNLKTMISAVNAIQSNRIHCKKLLHHFSIYSIFLFAKRMVSFFDTIKYLIRSVRLISI